MALNSCKETNVRLTDQQITPGPCDTVPTGAAVAVGAAVVTAVVVVLVCGSHDTDA